MTQLIRIHIISRIQWKLALVVAFTTLLSCSTELIVTVFHPSTHKVSLKVFQASYYSHHLIQYTLRETN